MEFENCDSQVLVGSFLDVKYVYAKLSIITPTRYEWLSMENPN